MDNYSMGAVFMAVCAVSGSVALLACQFHKRLLSEFMNKFESELLGTNKHHTKKKVRFTDDVAETMNNKLHQPSQVEHGGRSSTGARVGDVRGFETMPLNQQVLYKGIIEFKGVKGQYI